MDHARDTIEIILKNTTRLERSFTVIFKQDTLDYLIDVKRNNSKEWFSENKERYKDSLLIPFKEFVILLSEVMLKIDPEFEVEPRVDKTISRIYRDTRFSKDKSLYKNKAWVTFKKKGVDRIDYPTFFFELSPYDFRYGMGFFRASIKSMDAIRDKIDADEKKFFKIINQIHTEDIFSLVGDLYKRNRYQGTQDNVASWYNRKNLYLAHHSENINEIFFDKFIDRLKEDYGSLSLLYYFFIEALNEKWLESEGFEMWKN